MDYSKPPKGCLLIKEHNTMRLEFCIFRLFVSYFCWPPEIHTFLFNCWTSQMRFCYPQSIQKRHWKTSGPKSLREQVVQFRNPRCLPGLFVVEEIDPNDHMFDGWFCCMRWPCGWSQLFQKGTHIEAIINMGR